MGPAQVGSPAGDFGTIKPDHAPGWVVHGHHNDVLTYVDPADLAGGADADDLAMGLAGRGRRDQDGHDLEVVHVEDKR